MKITTTADGKVTNGRFIAKDEETLNEMEQMAADLAATAPEAEWNEDLEALLSVEKDYTEAEQYTLQNLTVITPDMLSEPAWKLLYGLYTAKEAGPYVHGAGFNDERDFDPRTLPVRVFSQEHVAVGSEGRNAQDHEERVQLALP